MNSLKTIKSYKIFFLSYMLLFLFMVLFYFFFLVPLRRNEAKGAESIPSPAAVVTKSTPPGLLETPQPVLSPTNIPILPDEQDSDYRELLLVLLFTPDFLHYAESNTGIKDYLETYADFFILLKKQALPEAEVVRFTTALSEMIESMTFSREQQIDLLQSVLRHWPIYAKILRQEKRGTTVFRRLSEALRVLNESETGSAYLSQFEYIDNRLFNAYSPGSSERYLYVLHRKYSGIAELLRRYYHDFTDLNSVAGELDYIKRAHFPLYQYITSRED